MGLTGNTKTINFIPLRRREAGLTLIELVVTMVITSIVGLGIVAQFATEQNFRTMIRDRIEISREARTAMHHMTYVLRFANPNLGSITAGTNQINATIERDHLGFITDPSGTAVQYTRIAATNVLQYTQAGDTVDIANDITAFSGAWNPPYIEIELTARKGNSSITVESKVRVLPD